MERIFPVAPDIRQVFAMNLDGEEFAVLYRLSKAIEWAPHLETVLAGGLLSDTEYAAHRFLLDCVVCWDIDDEGAEVPVTLEVIAALDEAVVADIVRVIGEDMKRVADETDDFITRGGQTIH